jgi:3',5'-cyclic AMP phosphodiesterase CpdA
MLHAGDLVNNGNKDGEWGEWFSAGGWLNGSLPTIAAPGNHEYRSGEDGKRQLTAHWGAQFAFPRNGPEGLESSVFYVDYQGARIIALNSMEKVAEQTAWLDQVLTNHHQRWTILTFHYPIFSAAQGRDNVELRAQWKPIIDKHRVDLVLQGHDHTYARTGLAVPDNLTSGANVVDQATVYVVSVSGPKMYKVESRPFQRRTAEGAQLYQVISVDGDQLQYRAATADGVLYDAFRLIKRSGQVNELIDEIPATSELRGLE